MAVYGFDDLSFILVDGYSVAGYITEVSDHEEATIEESTTAGASWATNAYTGLRQIGLTLKGFFDDADNASNEAFVEQFAARTICYGFEGNTTGQNLTMLSGPMEGKFSRLASKGEIHKIDVTLDGSGEKEDGKIIAPLTARTTAGNTNATPVNNTAGASTGGAAYLQMTALSLGGYTNVAVKLQDSADNITFADLASSEGQFTAVTAAPAKERKALTVSIKQYVSIAWSYTGAGSGQTFTALVGLHRN